MPSVFIIPAGFSGCAFWRMRLPMQKLQEVGSKLDILVSQSGEKSVQLAQIEKYASKADIIVLQAPGAFDAAHLINFFKLKGKKVVVDYDDYSFDLSPANPRYAELGTRECELLDKNGKYVYRWKDGENGFDLNDNIDRFEGFKACVEAADMVTVTTEYLASKFRPLNKNVVILPNSVDLDLWKPLPKLPEHDSQVRIGWFGGDSHFSDLWIFRKALPEVLKKYPQAKVVLQAPMLDFWMDTFKDIPKDRIEWYPWAQLDYYTLFLASRGIDIGLCPLEPDNEFNKCKSGIKMFEMAAFKVPSVCQNMLPYSEVVKHGFNGLLADTEQDWVNHISTLIENPDLRRVLGEDAFSEVQAKWSLTENCRLWEKAYLSLLEGPNASPSGRAGVGNSQRCGAGS